MDLIRAQTSDCMDAVVDIIQVPEAGESNGLKCVFIVTHNVACVVCIPLRKCAASNSVLTKVI